MGEYQTKTINCNGRLSKSYKVELRTKIDKDELEYSINIRLRLIKVDSNENSIIQLLKKQTLFSIYIDNERVEQKVLDLDFKTYSQAMIEYSFKISNEDVLSFNIKGEIEFTDNSNYLSNTEITDRLVLKPLKDNKLFITISGIERPEVIQVLINTTIEPDYLQYKTESTGWKKINNNIFHIPKLEILNQYIQVRGKKDYYFSYSNVIKLINGKIVN